MPQSENLPFFQDKTTLGACNKARYPEPPMILRRPADYRAMPWANGRGQTLEMLREDGPDGLTLRLSIATVVEDGAFSLLPGINRVLTVIAGPGFILRGDGITLHAAPLVPVAFSGDVLLRATDVVAPSEDFNVMIARGTVAPHVWLAKSGWIGAGTRLFLLALGVCRIDDIVLEARDLLETTRPVTLMGDGAVIAVRFG
jgi:uncharacterized protein